jgi:uncharacterized protein YegP (UPF0339 family)
MGKFLYKKTKTGYIFYIKASNGRTLATSEVYLTEAACLNGIESVRKNAPEASLEDVAAQGFPRFSNPKFEVFRDRAGKYRFRLKAKNGEIIAAGRPYKRKYSCYLGINSLKNGINTAKTVKKPHKP